MVRASAVHVFNPVVPHSARKISCDTVVLVYYNFGAKR